MKCYKIPRLTSPLSLLFVFVFSVIFSSFLVSSSFAVDDSVFNVPSSSYFELCSNTDFGTNDYANNKPCGYSFIKVEPSSGNLLTNLSWKCTSPSRTQSILVGAYLNFFISHPYGFEGICSSFQIYVLSDRGGPVTVTLTNSLGFPAPSGSIDITENGTFDVSSYAQANVNVPSEECSENGACTYNDKFDGVIKAIYTCGAVALVLYFFFCIYRIIIGTTGSQLK